MNGMRHLLKAVVARGEMIIELGGSLISTIDASNAPGGDADEVRARADIAAMQDDLELQRYENN
jgi:hypothetical protein